MPSPNLRCSAVSDVMDLEQKEGHASLDTFIRQAVGKEPLFSFSQTGESPIQWIQLLHALDQQGNGKLSKGSKVENVLEGKDRSKLELCNGAASVTSKMNGIKEQVSSVKGNGATVKGIKVPPDHLQTLKIPEAVVAFAQAAAKANGEPEKYLPGWPLLFPPKPQLQKCDKCLREFCSPINYRRHVRVHRRLLNIDKDSRKKRECLGAFWDKLSADEAKELVSFKNVTLEDVTGPSILRALSSLVRKPGFSSLPQTYIKAGAELLDVVQARPTRIPISSHELFAILDDASEKTFLCAGTAVSMQKFVFDGEAGKIALEMRNLVACTSFLIEQKLIKAWVDDKDAEALRCHKMLVEEEAAAQRRQAELQERKRLKKLRQKEHKAKEQLSIPQTVAECRESSPDTVVNMSFSIITSSQEAVSDTDSNSREALDDNQAYLGSVQSAVRLDSGHQLGTNEHEQMKYADTGGDSKVWKQVESGVRHLTGPRRLARKSSRSSGPYQIHFAQIPVFKSSMVKKRPGSLNGTHKVWTRKSKLEAVGRDSELSAHEGFRSHVNQNDKCEVLIGSISVALEECSAVDHISVRQKSSKEKFTVPDSSVQHVNILSSRKLWRPVGRYDLGAPVMAQENMLESEVDFLSVKDTVPGVDVASAAIFKPFSRHAAEVFLLQRWKVAIAGEHVKLVLPLGNEQQDCHDSGMLLVKDEPLLTSIGRSQCSPRGNADNQMSKSKATEMAGTMESLNRSKFQTKGERGNRLKYIPKQRNID